MSYNVNFRHCCMMQYYGLFVNEISFCPCPSFGNNCVCELSASTAGFLSSLTTKTQLASLKWNRKNIRTRRRCGFSQSENFLQCFRFTFASLRKRAVSRAIAHTHNYFLFCCYLNVILLHVDLLGQCVIIDLLSQSIHLIGWLWSKNYRGDAMVDTNGQKDLQKFHALDDEKKERIIVAAMKEFLAGYKHASTDNIVREAGISKGLLFHYFGTKENLYAYLIEYVADTFTEEFLNVLNISQPDILDSLWQASLLKYELSMKYPVIFDFITKAWIENEAKDSSIKVTIDRIMALRDKALADIYKCADLSLFRDDVDPYMGIKVISWAMNGYAESKAAEADKVSTGEPTGEVIRARYENYLEEFKGYLNFFRSCFYKKKEAE